MRLYGVAASHAGNVREINQDRAWFGEPVAVLADGMGGHQGGEVAAELAVGQFTGTREEIPIDELVFLVKSANRTVHQKAAELGLNGMGTTLVALTLHADSRISVANVGDSRAYVVRGDHLEQITEDHSFVEDLVRQGRLTPEEAAVHPQRNIVTRAVGIGGDVDVDHFIIEDPRIGDRYLLCSDGLFNEVAERDILSILTGLTEPDQAAEALIDVTLQTPCRDNVTVVVVDVVDDDDARLDDRVITEELLPESSGGVHTVSKSTLVNALDQPESLSSASTNGRTVVEGEATAMPSRAPDTLVGMPAVDVSSPPSVEPAAVERGEEFDDEQFHDTAEYRLSDSSIAPPRTNGGDQSLLLDPAPPKKKPRRAVKAIGALVVALLLAFAGLIVVWEFMPRFFYKALEGSTAEEATDTEFFVLHRGLPFSVLGWFESAVGEPVQLDASVVEQCLSDRVSSQTEAEDRCELAATTADPGSETEAGADGTAGSSEQEGDSDAAESNSLTTPADSATSTSVPAPPSSVAVTGTSEG